MTGIDGRENVLSSLSLRGAELKMREHAVHKMIISMVTPHTPDSTAMTAIMLMLVPGITIKVACEFEWRSYAAS